MLIAFGCKYISGSSKPIISCLSCVISFLLSRNALYLSNANTVERIKPVPCNLDDVETLLFIWISNTGLITLSASLKFARALIPVWGKTSEIILLISPIIFDISVLSSDGSNSCASLFKYSCASL